MRARLSAWSGRCRRSFRRRCSPTRSPAASSRRCRGSRSTPTGASTRCAPTGSPAGWTWRLASGRAKDLPATFRAPAAPYREKKHHLGPGFCCVCGQPVYAFGWHLDLWERGPNPKAQWHTACVTAWRLWNAPSDFVRVLRRVQQRRCAQTGGRLWRTAEVDHLVPLFRVWCEHRDTPWPKLLDYWGLPNLQVINRDVHVEKCADEAGWRRQYASQTADDAVEV